jgi:hypothetical protein
MKRKIIVAVVALQVTLMTSGAAFGQMSFTDAVMNTMWANFAGSHNRCPRFQVIDKAVSDELAAAGVTSEMLSNFTDQPQLLLDQYNEDPSEFCAKAWRRLGPNGTYKRQMLEAK